MSSLRESELESIIERLRSELALRDDLIKKQQLLIASLESRIEALEARLRQNSQNSSKPPSSDHFHKPKSPKSPTGRKPGGQPGHKAAVRPPVGEDEVTEIIDVVPERCDTCGQSLDSGERVDFKARQITELPALQPIVKEYRMWRVHCPNCGDDTQAKTPSDLPRESFGPSLLATAAFLTSRFRISRREIVSLFSHIFGISMSVGSVQHSCQVASRAVEQTYNQLREEVQHAPVVHADETSFGLCGLKRMWLWVARSVMITVFCLVPGRGKAQAKHLLGETFSGVIHRDRWRPYESLESAQSQICWSHLRRDFQAIAQMPEPTAKYGQRMFEASNNIFHLWHMFLRGEMDRRQLKQGIDPHKNRMDACLYALIHEEGIVPKARGMAKDILRLWKSLWTFEQQDGVVPTNNLAEQAIRPAVLWRKGSFGVNSEQGRCFVERMLTIQATAKSKAINGFQWLKKAVAANLMKKTVPIFK